MAIRPARPDELESLRAIEVAAGAAFRAIGMDAVADDAPPSTVALRSHLERGGLWVLEQAGVPVGYLAEDVVDGVAHLEQVSVDPAWSRRGLGRGLIEHLLARAGPVTLTTFVEVPWNGPYYERLGFRYLDDDTLGPGLRAVRRAEIARGLDRWPRAAMRRDP